MATRGGTEASEVCASEVSMKILLEVALATVTSAVSVSGPPESRKFGPPLRLAYCVTLAVLVMTSPGSTPGASCRS